MYPSLPRHAFLVTSATFQDLRHLECHVEIFGGLDQGSPVVVKIRPAGQLDLIEGYECRFAYNVTIHGKCPPVECGLHRFLGKIILLQLVKIAGGDEEILAEEVMTGGRKNVPIVMRVVAEHQKLRFEYGPDERSLNVLIDNVDASILSTEAAGGFVGTVVGMFAVSGGDYKEKKFFADFDWFRYENSGREWIC